MIPVRVYESAVFVFTDDCFQDSAKLFLSPEAMSTRRLPTFFRYCGVSAGQFSIVMSISKLVKMLKMRSPMRLPLSQIAFMFFILSGNKFIDVLNHKPLTKYRQVLNLSLQ